MGLAEAHISYTISHVQTPEQEQDNMACACVCVQWGHRTHTDPAVKITKEAAGEPAHRDLDSSG